VNGVHSPRHRALRTASQFWCKEGLLRVRLLLTEVISKRELRLGIGGPLGPRRIGLSGSS